MEPAEVRHIAHLARLGINETDIPAYARDLGAILELVAQMNAIDGRGIEPLAHPLEMAQRLRPDEVTEADRRTHYQAGAPLTEDGLYLVPRVIE